MEYLYLQFGSFLAFWGKCRLLMIIPYHGVSGIQKKNYGTSAFWLGRSGINYHKLPFSTAICWFTRTWMIWWWVKSYSNTADENPISQLFEGSLGYWGFWLKAICEIKRSSLLLYLLHWHDLREESKEQDGTRDFPVSASLIQTLEWRHS